MTTYTHILSEEILLPIGEANGVPRLCGFLACKGKLYDGELMVVGRAVNGWAGDISLGEIASAESRRRFSKDVAGSGSGKRSAIGFSAGLRLRVPRGFARPARAGGEVLREAGREVVREADASASAGPSTTPASGAPFPAPRPKGTRTRVPGGREVSPGRSSGRGTE